MPSKKQQEEDFLATLLQEVQIAAWVGFGITMLVMAHRWATRWLGSGLLSTEIMAGGPIIAAAIQHAEENVARQRTRHPRKSPKPVPES